MDSLGRGLRFTLPYGEELKELTYEDAKKRYLYFFRREKREVGKGEEKKEEKKVTLSCSEFFALRQYLCSIYSPEEMRKDSLFDSISNKEDLSSFELNFRNSQDALYMGLEEANRLLNCKLACGIPLDSHEINFVKNFIIFDVNDREGKMLCKKLVNDLALNGNEQLTKDEFIFLGEYLIKKGYQFVRINTKEISELAIQEWVEFINDYVKRKDVLGLVQYCKALEIMEMLDKMWSKYELIEQTNEGLLVNLNNSAGENAKINSRRDRILKLIDKINKECEDYYNGYYLYWQKHYKKYTGTTLDIDKVLDLVAFFYKNKTIGNWVRSLHSNRLF